MLLHVLVAHQPSRLIFSIGQYHPGCICQTKMWHILLALAGGAIGDWGERSGEEVWLVAMSVGWGPSQYQQTYWNTWSWGCTRWAPYPNQNARVRWCGRRWRWWPWSTRRWRRGCTCNQSTWGGGCRRWAVACKQPGCGNVRRFSL